MKKILCLAAIVALFAFSCSVSKFQKTDRAASNYEYALNKFTGKMDIVGGASLTKTFTSTQINTGSQLIAIPAPTSGILNISQILCSLGSGTAYTIASGAASDTVSKFLCYSKDTLRVIATLSNKFFTGAKSTTSLTPVSYSIDPGTALYFDPSDRLQVGTKVPTFTFSMGGSSGTVTIGTESQSTVNSKVGVFNVLDYGAVADTSVNSTAAIQACFNAAKDATVIVPGLFRVDSVHVEYNVKIIGTGGYSYDKTSTSGFYSRTNHAIINFDYGKGDGAGYGGRMQDLIILGKTTLTSQIGVKISGESDFLLERVYIASCGSHGVYFDPTVHTTTPQIQYCRIENNHGDGIYGVGNSDGYQLNAVNIDHNHILGNTGNGIHIWGTSNRITYNTIEGNGGIGVFVSARVLGAVTTTNFGTTIAYNYMEQNVGGNIIAESYLNGGVNQYVYGLNIRENYLYLTDAVSSSTANILLRTATGSSSHAMFRNMLIQGNVYGGDLYNVAGSIINWSYFSPTGTIYCTEAATSFATYYSGLTSIEGAPTIYFEEPISAVRYESITAAGGVTELHKNIRLVSDPGTPITLSANPQLPNGIPEQEVTLIGSDNTNTITIIDGNGVQLNGGSNCVLGEGDMLHLIYIGWLSDWYEQWRTNN